MMDIKGKILNGIFHFNRLKQAFLRITKIPVNTQVDPIQIINLRIRINNKNKMHECGKNDVFQDMFLVTYKL